MYFFERLCGQNLVGLLENQQSLTGLDVSYEMGGNCWIRVMKEYGNVVFLPQQLPSRVTSLQCTLLNPKQDLPKCTWKHALIVIDLNCRYWRAQIIVYVNKYPLFL